MSIGSRGDVQPFIALGQGLMRAGHEVKLASNSTFAGMITGAGLGFALISGNPQQLIEDNREALTKRSVFGGFNFAMTLLRLVEPLLEQINEEAISACADAEALIYSPTMMVPGLAISDQRRIPGTLAQLAPTFTPTREITPIFLPELPLPNLLRGWYNQLGYGITKQFGRLIWSRFGNPLRRELGLKPLSLGAIYRRQQRGRIQTLCGWSRHVVPKPADWPAAHQVTGYWFVNPALVEPPTPGLVEFLQAGPKPIYCGFGSMVGGNSLQLSQTILAAVERTGCRAVLATGWGGLVADEVPDNVFVIERVAHDWLFPQTAAVVHHGGAGTTAAGIKAGVPGIIIPFLAADQQFWGNRLAKLGVGVPPRRYQDVTVDWLAEALTAVQAAEVQQRASALGEQVQAEGGVEQAVAVFEAHTARWHSRAMQTVSP